MYWYDSWWTCNMLCLAGQLWWWGNPQVPHGYSRFHLSLSLENFIRLSLSNGGINTHPWHLCCFAPFWLTTGNFCWGGQLFTGMVICLNSTHYIPFHTGECLPCPWYSWSPCFDRPLALNVLVTLFWRHTTDSSASSSLSLDTSIIISVTTNVIKVVLPFCGNFPCFVVEIPPVTVGCTDPSDSNHILNLKMLVGLPTCRSCHNSNIVMASWFVSLEGSLNATSTGQYWPEIYVAQSPEIAAQGTMTLTCPQAFPVM